MGGDRTQRRRRATMRLVPSSLRGSAGPLTQDHDVALLDLDGVIYLGADAVPGAASALAAARDQDMRLAFVTNNAARPPHVVADHLNDLGIAARVDEIVTSAQAAARYLSDRLPGGASVLVVGTTGLEEALRERGLVPVATAEGQVDAVVQGYSPEMNWRLLAEGAIAINRGVVWVATNLDPTVPSTRGPLPGNGSLVAALRHATRREPVATGKPDPTMHRESVLRSRAQHPIVVGDRLDTDIEGANAVGCPSLLVFSGVTTVLELLAAPAALRPTYIAADVAGLLDAHPEPDISDGAARCGHWEVTARPHTLVLSRIDADAEAETASDTDANADTETDTDGSRQPSTWDADALDAVRALCAAQWEHGDTTNEGVPDNEDAGSGGPASVLAADGDDAAAAMVERLGLSS